MSATRRRNIADTMDELDRQIWDLQQSKKDIYTSYREALKKDGMRDADVKTEVEALKKSIALRRKIIETPGAVDEMDAKVDEILADLLAKRKVGTEYAVRAPVARVAREAAAETPHDAETGEITEAAEVDPVDAFVKIGAAIQQAVADRPAPYRIPPTTPAPEPVDPDASPLIVDREARLANAKALIERQQAGAA